MRKPSIAFCCPNYGSIDSNVYANHLAAIANASRTFDVKFVGVTDKMALHNACNQLVKESLITGVDFIFWVENDMLVPFDCITKLYERKKEICSGLYFLRNANYVPCMWMFMGDDYKMQPVCMFKENEVMKVDVPGMGCVLYNADVFRKLDDPWFDQTDKGYGQDVYFYRKAKDAGLDVFVDTNVQCGHLDAKKVITIADYREHLADLTTRMSGFVNVEKKV